MSSEKRRRLQSTPFLGFSPYLRSLSRLPPPPLRTCANSPLSRKHEDHRPPDRMDHGESQGNDEEEEEEEDELSEETVQVDFGFFDPKPGDFHGVKLLLRWYLDERPWDRIGFVDLILEQTTVGTVVKGDNGEEGGDGGGNHDVDYDGLYAVISALNLETYAKHQSIKDVKDYVLGICKEEALKVKLGLLLGEKAKDVGLLVCERFVNFPNQAVLPLYEGLFDEVGWATEDEPTKEARDSFRFKFYLVVTRIYVNKNAERKNGAKASLAQKNNISNKSKRKYCDEEPIVYIKAEDEIFHKLSSINFTFDLHCQAVPAEMKNYRKMGLVMLVESQKVPTFRKELSHIAQS